MISQRRATDKVSRAVVRIQAGVARCSVRTARWAETVRNDGMVAAQGRTPDGGSSATPGAVFHWLFRHLDGSSGEPLAIRHTRLEAVLGGILRLRTVRALGLCASDREASVILRPTSTHNNPLSLRLLQMLSLYRKVRMSCLLPPDDIIRALRDFRPDVLSGFAGVLARLAQTISSDDRLVLRPRFITVGGEVLTPLMRRHITQAFAAPVFDLYLSHEFNLLAWECRETGELHTCNDNVIIEVLKDGRPALHTPRRQGVRYGEPQGAMLSRAQMRFLRQVWHSRLRRDTVALVHTPDLVSFEWRRHRGCPLQESPS